MQYLERDDIAPLGHRAWYPEPRGVGRSSGGPHTMEQAIADIEAIRRAVEVDSWMVIGHSWGCDLGVRYAIEHPEAVTALVGIAGRGPQRDFTWSTAYEAGKSTEPVVEIDWDPEVHVASAHRSPSGSTVRTCGADWPTVKCQCTSSLPATTSARPGRSRSLPNSFHTALSRQSLRSRMTSGPLTQTGGRRPSPTPAPFVRQPSNSVLIDDRLTRPLLAVKSVKPVTHDVKWRCSCEARWRCSFRWIIRTSRTNRRPAAIDGVRQSAYWFGERRHGADRRAGETRDPHRRP
ncbi:MAG: alpha/beta hydrolase [Actinomycetota bacterium]|nr:alpha/beta hydrolase [Actinomycetota bacterium]